MADYSQTIEEAVLEVENRLLSENKEKEAARFLFLQRKKWALTEWVKYKGNPISTEDLEMLQEDEEKLLQDIPPQYILGFGEFLDWTFKVTSDTLIPRPETEELVMKAISICVEESPLNVVDIGTGTGAIAISVALLRPQWTVSASDISIGALNVARENAKKLGADVFFDLGDTLSPFMEQTRELDDFEQFDLILSNPPYISKDEKEVMDESVKKYEPEIALYAEDEGLAIYKKIAEQSPFVLKQSGQMLLEIGFQQGEKIKTIFEFAFPTRKVEIVKDMAGLDRMIWVHAIEKIEEEGK